MSSTTLQWHHSQSLCKGPPNQGGFEGLLDPLCSMAALVVSEPQVRVHRTGERLGIPCGCCSASQVNESAGGR